MLEVISPIAEAADFEQRNGHAVDAESVPLIFAEQARPAVLTRWETTALRTLERHFRDLYTHALPELKEGSPVVIGVTSAIRGEGRTGTALGLALAIASDLDARVLLAELDLERPVLAREMGLPETPGLVDVTSGDVPLELALRPLGGGAIDLLPVGRAPNSASRVLRSAAMRELLSQARAAYQVTILDLPPTLVSSDVLPLAALADGILMVVRAGITPAGMAEQAVARFSQGAIRGLVLNGQRSKIPNWLRNLI